MMMLADVSADGPVDGMGDKRSDGSYIRLYVKGDGQYGHHYRISRGQAETLIAELQGALQIDDDVSAGWRSAGAPPR